MSQVETDLVSIEKNCLD